MKPHKKIIILGISSFSILGISFFAWQKNNSNHRNSSIAQKKQNNLSLIKKKKSISENESLTSYFSVFLIFGMIILIIIKMIKDYRFQIPKNQKTAFHFLIFIKVVLEMIAFDNCARKKNTLHRKTLTFDPIFFIDECILYEQNKNNNIRLQAREIYLDYQRKAPFINFMFPLYILITYLLVFIINIIVNFFFHGKKTWKRLKWNSLWMMIPNMTEKYKRIISYSILILLSICYPVKYIFKRFFANRLRHHYWLLEDLSSTFFQKTGEQKFSFMESLSITKNKMKISSHNLDKNNLQDFDENVTTMESKIKTDALKKYLTNMITYFDLGDGNEKMFYEEICLFAGITIKDDNKQLTK